MTWPIYASAARAPLFRFITMQYNGHLQPGQFLLVWLVTKIGPLNYGVAVAPVLFATFVGGVLMWRFLGALFGEGSPNLVPLAVLMLCPLSVPPALWWAASLQVIVLQVFIVATLFAVLRYFRAPSTWRLITVGLVYGGALLFWEKALLILPLVALFVLFFLGEGSGPERMRSVWRDRWRLWAVLGGVVAVYLGWYLAVAKWQLSSNVTASGVGRLAVKVVGSTVIPTYLGGPWAVAPVRDVLYELPLFPRLLTWVAFALIVGVSVLLRRQSWRAWILLVAYLGLDMAALLASGRLGLIGPVIGLVARYVADSVPVFALALGLAYRLPLERRSDPTGARRLLVLDRSESGPEALEAPREGRTPAWTRRASVAVVVVYALSAMITSFRIAGLAEVYSAKEWFATVRSQLALHPTASIFDSYLPAGVISAAFFPEDAKASRALAPIARHVRGNAPAEQPLIFDTAGHLRPVEVGHATTAAPGPVRGCGYLVGRKPVVAPLQQRLFAWEWGVVLAYYTNREAKGFVTVDGDRQSVTFLQGTHTLTLVHHGTATLLTIEGGGSSLCIGTITIGDVKPSLAGDV